MKNTIRLELSLAQRLQRAWYLQALIGAVGAAVVLALMYCVFALIY